MAVSPEFKLATDSNSKFTWTGALTASGDDNVIPHQPILDNHLVSNALMDWLNKPTDKKLVYVSLGSVLHNYTWLFRKIIDGLSKNEKLRIVVAAGDSLLSLRKKYSLYENIFLVQYAPQVCLYSVLLCGSY